MTHIEADKTLLKNPGKCAGADSNDAHAAILEKIVFRINPRARGKGRKAARLSRNFSLVINTIERRWAKEDVLGSNEGHRYLRQEKKKT